MEYERIIRSHSAIGGWVDGSIWTTASLDVWVDSRLKSHFSLIACPDNR